MFEIYSANITAASFNVFCQCSTFSGVDFQKNKVFDAGCPNVGIQSDRLSLVKFTGYFIVSLAFRYPYSFQHF